LSLAKIGILGCGGRMGRMLLQEVLSRSEAKLAGGVEAAGSALIGADLGTLIGAGPTGIKVGDDPTPLFRDSDAVIDFTHPAALARHAALAVEHKTALVVGTTGLDDKALAVLAEAAKQTVIVRSANMSVGVTLLTALVEQLAASLSADVFDIEITEMHHRHKIDAPSGTALALGEAAARGRQVALDRVWRKSRDGQVGARPAGEIGFSTLRGGDVVGDHSVIFAADGERLELSHKASSRQIFARGAVRAALWAAGRAPGLYGMKDVLGL
jgi:4-hydroxy-tetrahydrodipicolinate reductase